MTLLTTWGLIGDAKSEVPHIVILSSSRVLYRLFVLLRKWVLSRWMVMFCENILTLRKAVQLKRKFNYDVIHLRDGEPFFFLPHLLSFPFKGFNWVIWLTASNIYPPTTKSFQVSIYKVMVKFVNSRLWKSLYRNSLSRNNFVFLTENETARQDYSAYLGGILAGKVFCVPLGAGKPVKIISKEKAKRHLGLPQDKPIFLSFGAPHSGKDVETIFRALSDLPDVCLVHAGTQAFGLGTNTTNLAKNYTEPNRMIIRDCYIPEEEKPYYFFASDAMILSYKRHFLSTSSLLWESCRYETPVISSDNVQLAKLIKGYKVGLLFKSQDPDSLRNAVIRFGRLAPEQIDIFKDNCHKFANEFPIDKWAGKCLEIYQRMLI